MESITKDNRQKGIIKFKKSTYDPSIDFIKGTCILFVILTHCIYRDVLGYMLFPYWGDTAVPIFLLIQVFHYYKKGISLRMPSIPKLGKRIVLPFIFMIALMFLVQFFIYHDVTDGVFSPSFYWSKRGPGSYYIFVYLEFAFVIPLLTPLFKKLSVKWLFVVFVVLSQLVELVCSITHCPDNIYRITFFRYIFLIFLGFLLATKGLELNKFTIAGSIISMVFIFLFAYSGIDMEPVFCTHLSLWPLCHWVCYVYIAYFFLACLRYTYTALNRHSTFITSYVMKMGKWSYDIFLFQIFYYATLSTYVGQSLCFIGSATLRQTIYVLISTAICVMPVVYLKKRGRISLP